MTEKTTEMNEKNKQQLGWVVVLACLVILCFAVYLTYQNRTMEGTCISMKVYEDAKEIYGDKPFMICRMDGTGCIPIRDNTYGS